MDSYFFLLTIEPGYIILFFSIVFFCITVGFFIVLPLIKRIKGRRRYKEIIKRFNADCAIECLQHSGLAGVDRFGGPLTRMYLIATNDSLLVTDQIDFSYKIEVSFSKISAYSYDGRDLEITVPSKTGFGILDLRIIERRDNDSFNRYALKHANIIDYIAARVPKEEVNIRL